MKEGLSKKEIYNFLSDKYGDWILFNTPLKANSYFLWFMPYVLFILGGIFLYLVIKKALKRQSNKLYTFLNLNCIFFKYEN